MIVFSLTILWIWHSNVSELACDLIVCAFVLNVDINNTSCYPPGSYSKQNYFPSVEFLGFIINDMMSGTLKKITCFSNLKAIEIKWDAMLEYNSIYVYLRKKAEAEDDHQAVSAFAESIDSAVPCAKFLAYLLLFHYISRLVRFAMSFITACPCHCDLNNRLLR